MGPPPLVVVDAIVDLRFHPVEALMLGNVIVATVLVADSASASLAALPVFRLCSTVSATPITMPASACVQPLVRGEPKPSSPSRLPSGNYGFQFHRSWIVCSARAGVRCRRSDPFGRRKRRIVTVHCRVDARLRDRRDWQSLAYLVALPGLAAWQWLHGLTVLLYVTM